MSELAQAMRILGNMGTAILQCPTGKYTLVGSVPVSLCYWKDGPFPQWSPNVYSTEAEAIAALLGVGVEEFQLADCSWYKHEREQTCYT